MSDIKSIDIVVVDSSYQGADSKIYEINPFDQCVFGSYEALTGKFMHQMVHEKLRNLFPDRILEIDAAPSEIDIDDAEMIYVWPNNAHDISQYKFNLIQDGTEPQCTICDFNPALRLAMNNKAMTPHLFGNNDVVKHAFPRQVAYFYDPDSITADLVKTDLENSDLLVFKPSSQVGSIGINIIERENLNRFLPVLLGQQDSQDRLFQKFLKSAHAYGSFQSKEWPPYEFPGFVVQEGCLSDPVKFGQDKRESLPTARTVWIIVDGEKDPIFTAFPNALTTLATETKNLPSYPEWIKQLLKSRDPLNVALGINMLANIYDTPSTPELGRTNEIPEKLLDECMRDVMDVLQKGPPSLKRYLYALSQKYDSQAQTSPFLERLSAVFAKTPGLKPDQPEAP